MGKLLYKLFKDNKIEAKDESRPSLHSYYKFSKFNNLNIDEAPLIKQLNQSIVSTNKKGKISFETSSFLSFTQKKFIQNLVLNYYFN